MNIMIVVFGIVILNSTVFQMLLLALLLFSFLTIPSRPGTQIVGPEVPLRAPVSQMVGPWFQHAEATILYYTILYYTILYYTILDYTILYYTMLCCTILY